MRVLFNDAPLLVAAVGPSASSSTFAELWTSAGDCSARVQMNQLVYEARSIAVPPCMGGKLVVADDSMFDLALDWSGAFARECHLQEADDPKLLEETVSRVVTRKLLYFWRKEDGEVVSMAARNRESPHGATVSLVYTPEEFRGQGNASRVVGYLSQQILESGKAFCTLYTDTSNPSSNSIYRQLGYEVVGESTHYVFEDGREASSAGARGSTSS